ncbi:hypothetical protein LU680_07795 [Pseudomonas monteilii]|uniref:DUF1983 domain-containing protein n=1 Tax=Pseudomonas asiatica TaxID=2219225 RepID=A0AAJ5HZD1_9PSED|nr:MULTISPECIES: hypothetical protein [Pseudomonas]GJB83962.1 hypothetical protein KAM380_084270 [Aeromonas caviae]AYO01527.1 hypothetical protein D8767_22355 [Pseudomonas sp. LTGT-11-2Z]MCE0981676.1 hypothetical protein [Pseudomonas monteilii]MDH0025549.1 hypothetical protein [Pseudomonas monteilii]UUC17552.1 hypothetical protein NOV18_20110 [Pseudomonas asiatica]
MKYTGLQTADNVPGISGMRLDFKTGAIEITSGRLPDESQMVTVTAGEWVESDIPANAIERYRFIGDQVMAIPAEHRDSAEFTTEDMSFDRDGSDIRTTLTYQRLETDQEAAERVSRQVGSGVVINDAGMTITRNGKVIARLGCRMDGEQPFAFKGDQLFINEASMDSAAITTEVTARASADEALRTHIGGLPIAPSDGQVADLIRQVIRKELQLGGMLHRR